MNVKMLVRTAGALVFCSLLFGVSGCQTREPLLYVNGTAVTEEEMALLNDDADTAVRMKVLQQTAEEYGVIDAFSLEELKSDLEQENQRRAQQLQDGEVVYGIQEYTLVQYYNIVMGEYESSLEDTLAEAASEENLLEYYHSHLEDYEEIGETSADVKLYSGRELVNQFSIELTDSTYRSISEQNAELAANLGIMEEGETETWTDEYGLEWQVTCTDKTDSSYAAFEDVRGAVAEQYAAAQLQKILDNKITESKVEDLR